MFDNVMIGIDGKQGGHDAIALARQLVSEEGKLTLAYVHGGYPVMFKCSGGNSPFVQKEQERAQQVLAETARHTGLDLSLAAIGSPSVAQGLHELAEQHSADLLVVGFDRHGLLGRVLRGDDTRAALNGAPCSVAVAPAGYADHAKPLQRIGVAFNDSPQSRHALTVARELGTYFGAKLSACDVFVSPVYMYPGVPRRVSPADADLAEMFGPGLFDDIELKAGYGSPPEGLGFYSRSVDLLIIGSRGYGPVGRIVHGSTSAELTRFARCPLLVLKRSGGVEADAAAVGSLEVSVHA